MSLVEEYLNSFKPNLDAAINMALPGMADNLSEEIKQYTFYNVYSYPAGMEALSKRRYMLGDKSNLQVETLNHELRITNVTQLQEDGGNETEWVEQGINQGRAGPRPFMEPALESYVGGGQADSDLRSALIAAGFEVY